MNFVPVLVVALAATVAGAIAFWPRILTWVRTTLVERWPGLGDLVTDALVALDGVASPIRQAARAAWLKLRETFVRVTVTFLQKAGVWHRRIETWTADQAMRARGEFSQVIQEKVIPFDELPPEVRESFLRNPVADLTVDVTAQRDRELLQQAE